ncbi:hypothetical protein Lalb_Chr15g0079661 [Lupinus albus]|uniref:Uncharacterized protein n=1 Tax=Lupinus albus TaxID=3870 RepID=A0A6A4P8Q3_LUPAL|nr:hypothetical protein Lalb_Chr15g0079661 [Lupinus albus]
MTPFIKLERFPPLIIITLLLTLRYPHILPYFLNLLCRFSDHLGSQHQVLSSFKPTHRSCTFPPIQSFIGCHSNTRIKTVIVRKLDQRQHTVPTARLFQYTCS